MAKFRKKPVVVEAMQWNGDNSQEIAKFLDRAVSSNWIDTITIATLSVAIKAFRGDWIVRGEDNEFFVCKPDVFEKTYESVDSEASN